MRTKGATNQGILSYEIVNEWVLQNRTYKLLKFSLPNVSARTRRIILERVLNELGAIGLIEWWLRGSIVKKPRQHFYGIVILETHSKNVSESKEIR